MYRTFFVFLKCTIQCGPKVDVLLIAFLYSWLKFWEGIDKYWIVPDLPGRQFFVERPSTCYAQNLLFVSFVTRACGNIAHGPLAFVVNREITDTHEPDAANQT